MRIDIITVVPELLVSPLNESILKRAQQKGLVEIAVHNLRDYTFDRYRQVDDYPFGGEAGMVMKPEPIFRCIEQLQSERTYDEVIYTSPDGIRYNQHEANRLSTLGNIVILCGHYKGIDYRVREHLITLEISIGDYVLTGGELAAAIIADSVVRVIPGAIGDEASALTDSFQDNLLRRSTRARPISAAGKCRMSCCRAIRKRSPNGRRSRLSNARKGFGPTCSIRNRFERTPSRPRQSQLRCRYRTDPDVRSICLPHAPSCVRETTRMRPTAGNRRKALSESYPRHIWRFKQMQSKHETT